MTRCVPCAGMPETTSLAGRPSADGSRSSSNRNDVAAVERFSTSICTVTRVPGATRMSESDRWIAIRCRPQRTKSAAIAGNAARPSATTSRPGEPMMPSGQPHGESGEQDGHPAAGRHQGFSATGTGTSARISSRMT